MSCDQITLRARDFAWFRHLIHRQAGIRLSEAKAPMLVSRLSRRVRQLGLASLAEYAQLLATEEDDGPERRELINCITTNKTDFFREPHHFELLRDQLIPKLRERAVRGRPRRVRIWSAGCSTGQEPYTIAMVLRDALAAVPGWEIQIVASDIDTRVLAAAERGSYQDGELRAVPEALRRRHFRRDRGASAGAWTVRPEVRGLVEFRRINLNETPWPVPGDFDAILCRNVMIYFDRPTQRRLLENLAGRLTPSGYLFLGHSESVLGLSDRFVLVGRTVHRMRRDVQPSPPAAARVSPVTRLPLRRIIVGEVFASGEPAMVGTVLGSCVSACLFDPTARIGGMNHFLLPSGDDDGLRKTRYGVHAMELLINEIMNLGGDRRRLVAKIFGGGHLLAHGPADLPEQNVRFVREFLRVEKIPLIAERVGGTAAMDVWFHTTTGRAQFRQVLERLPDVLAEEASARARLDEQVGRAAPPGTLF